MDQNLRALHRQRNKESFVCQRITDIKPYISSFLGKFYHFLNKFDDVSYEF